MVTDSTETSRKESVLAGESESCADAVWADVSRNRIKPNRRYLLLTGVIIADDDLGNRNQWCIRAYTRSQKIVWHKDKSIKKARKLIFGLFFEIGGDAGGRTRVRDGKHAGHYMLSLFTVVSVPVCQ